MTDETTPQGSAAMPPASDGSVAILRELRVPDWRGVTVDLWIDADGDLGVVSDEPPHATVIHRTAIPAIAEWLGVDTLTDAEREAVEKLRKWAYEIARDNAFIDEVCDAADAAHKALTAFLERHK